MTDPTITEDDSARASTRQRALGWLGASALLVVVLVLFMHVFAPPITSDEAPPSGHPQSACIACHMVTGPAEGLEAQ